MRQLVALDRLVGRSSTIEARYRPRGGRPDRRPAQHDGWGWAIWALSATERAWRDTPSADGLSDLAHHCASQLLRRVGPDSLPHPSPDYWEVEAPDLTLGATAPSLFGLERAASLLSQHADSRLRETAARCRESATQVKHRIFETFGSTGWPREIDGIKSDAAITFMLPLYRTAPQREGDIRDAIGKAAAEMRRGNGGYAPGGDWKSDGVAWTPETALLARSWATDKATTQNSLQALTWLAEHRTPTLSLSEKVWHDGTPAVPAPLAWTAALCLETGFILEG